MITTDIILVTPEMAKNWLDTNKANIRKIDMRRVNSYIRQITSGEFRTTHQGIAFHKNGSLADGQHRLMAILLSGIPVYLQVSWGLTDEDVLTLDQNRPRRYGNIMKYVGRSENQHHFAIARILSQGPGPVEYQSIPELLGVIEKYKAGIDYSLSLGNERGFTNHIKAPIARAFYSCDLVRLGEFKEVFSTNSARSPEDWAATRLRVYVDTTRGQGLEKLRRDYYIAEKAIWLFMKRYPCRALYPAKKELFPLPEEEDRGVVRV